MFSQFRAFWLLGASIPGALTLPRISSEMKNFAAGSSDCNELDNVEGNAERLKNPTGVSMRRFQRCLTVGFCLFCVTGFAEAQQTKAGLWEMTTTLSFQQSPFPAGSPAATAAAQPHVHQLCLTQEQVDKYGPILPTTGKGDCHIANVNKTAHSMSAQLMCAGMMSGNGTLETTFQATTASAKGHFTGSIQQQGGNPMPFEWSATMTAVFKSADCGAVQPAPMPEVPAPSNPAPNSQPSPQPQSGTQPPSDR